MAHLLKSMGFEGRNIGIDCLKTKSWGQLKCPMEREREHGGPVSQESRAKGIFKICELPSYQTYSQEMKLWV